MKVMTAGPSVKFRGEDLDRTMGHQFNLKVMLPGVYDDTVDQDGKSVFNNKQEHDLNMLTVVGEKYIQPTIYLLPSWLYEPGRL